MALGTAAAGAYSSLSGHGVLPLWLTISLCSAAFLWAGYYVSLRYVADTAGIERRILWRTSHRTWAELRRATLSRSDSQGVSLCRITLVFADTQWTISSEVFAPDAVHELADDLTAAGIAAQQNQASV